MSITRVAKYAFNFGRKLFPSDHHTYAYNIAI